MNHFNRVKDLVGKGLCARTRGPYSETNVEKGWPLVKVHIHTVEGYAAKET
jgi:hypothetical protein